MTAKVLERTPTTPDATHSIDNALEAALLVMRSGGATTAAERTFANFLKSAGRDDVSAIWRLDFIAATEDGATHLRAVGPIGVNLARASAVAVLGERAAAGEAAPSTIEAELERIKQLPSPYGRWVTIALAAFTGACFSQLPGGDWGSFGIAAVAAGLGQLLRSELQARKVAAAPVTLICGLVSALIACVGLRFGFSQVASATLIASVIYLVPGLPLINGFIDVTSHRHLMVGVERIVNAAYLFLLLAIAMAFAHIMVL